MPTLPPRFVEARVDRDRVHQGPGRSVALDADIFVDELGEDLAHDLLGVGVVARDAIGEPVDALSVATDQRVDRITAARLGLRKPCTIFATHLGTRAPSDPGREEKNTPPCRRLRFAFCVAWAPPLRVSSCF